MPAVSRREIERGFADFDFFRFIDEADRERFADELEKLMTETPFPRSSVFPDTVECLISLKNEGFTLGLATSRIGRPEELAKHLAHTGIVKYFSHIATRNESSVHWSDKKAQLLEVCRELAISPAESILVSDIPSDIQGAKEIGCGLTVAMTTGGTRPEILAQAEPDLLLSSLEELAACVSKV